MRLPNLSTPRLILREFTLEDFAALREIEGDPAIFKYRNRKAITEEETRQFLANCLRSQSKQPRDSYPWAVVLLSENILIGQVGLTMLPTEELAAGHAPGSEAFLWGSINRRYWNLGIMSEALPAVIRYGFRQIGLLTIHGRSQAENIGSWRALEKAGMKRAGLIPVSDQSPAQYDYILTKDAFESELS